ncbi:hypothetical protein HY407_02580 [Candidatus Gottesmanbacteria bacterium]|nr:hypothetical protein [Candidatus Gottesmanbacteria bacterium]
MKRYQVYLNSQSVNILDEATEISQFTRAQLIREAIDGAASRLGNILAGLKPPKARDYDWLNKLVGSIKIRGKKKTNISQNVDEIYYR